MDKSPEPGPGGGLGSVFPDMPPPSSMPQFPESILKGDVAYECPTKPLLSRILKYFLLIVCSKSEEFETGPCSRPLPTSGFSLSLHFVKGQLSRPENGGLSCM